MIKTVILALTACLLRSVDIQAQAMDNLLSSGNIAGNKYFRINYENDFFAASDRDYTQGFLIEKVHPDIRRFPLVKLLWHPKNNETRYGLAVEHNAYTPNEIGEYGVQVGDRPYAAVLLLKTFLISDDFDCRLRISVSFNAGIVGQGAGGEKVQRTIHHWINYMQPLGWHNQIQNDLALNYQVNAEKEIFQCKKLFFILVYGSARIGTLSDKMAAGLTGSFGNFSSPFSRHGISHKSIRWHSYFSLMGSAVGYDASLQGGVFNHSSVYTIDAAEINRFTLQYKFGLVLVFRSVYLEYYRTGITKEFNTGIYHRTGGLQIGFGF
jgi:lipid A 3-O-deacylase